MPPTAVSWFAAPAAWPIAASGQRQNSERSAESPTPHIERTAKTTTESTRTMPSARSQVRPSSSCVNTYCSCCPNSGVASTRYPDTVRKERNAAPAVATTHAAAPPDAMRMTRSYSGRSRLTTQAANTSALIVTAAARL